MFSARLRGPGAPVGLLALALVLSACDFSGLQNLADDFQIAIELEPINTEVTGMVIDAATGDYVDVPVQVSFQGPYGRDVIDIFSDVIPGVKITGGYLSFGLRNEVVPTAESPVEVLVVAKAPGYQATSKRVRVSSVGDHSFTLYMANNVRPPDGGVTMQGESQASSGTTSAAVTVESGREQQSGGSASVTVPAGAQVQSAAGQPVSGQVLTRVTYFNPQAEGAQRAFPGGASTTLQTGSGTGNGSLAVAGFAAIEMYDTGGNTVSVSGQALGVRLSIPEGRLNPRTGSPYQVGDRVKAWRFNGATGGWVQIGETTLTTAAGKSGSGGAECTFPVSLNGEPVNLTVSCANEAVAETGDGSENVCPASEASTIFVQRNGHTGDLRVNVGIQGAEASYLLKSGQNAFRASDFTSPVPRAEATASVRTASGTATATGNLCGETITVALNAPAAPSREITFVGKLSCAIVATSIPTNQVAVKVNGVPTGTSTVDFTAGPDGHVSQGLVVVGGLYTGDQVEFRASYTNGSTTETRTANGTVGAGDTVNISLSVPSDYCGTAAF